MWLVIIISAARSSYETCAAILLRSLKPLAERVRRATSVTRGSQLFFYCFQPRPSSAPNSANPLLYPVIEGAAHSPRRSRRKSCRPTAGGRNLNHMIQRCRRGPLGRGPLSLTATAILLREDRNRDSPLQFERRNEKKLS